VFAFARVWNAGDATAVARLVAPEPQYRWVSVGPPGGRSGPSAFSRGSVGVYILARHAQHDRLTMRSFRFNGSDVRGRDVFGHFEFVATRNADDWPAALDHVRPGKGAIVCNLSRPMLAVWSLG
jgi:hypothetical protein